MNPYVFIAMILAVFVTGCSNGHSAPRLENIARMVSDSPQMALDSLKSIDSDLLSESDRNFYDFLTIKASDKAYIRHTSDSLVLKVIDFESRHKDRGLYVEALYYGGRVFSDMGDSPMALKYFQDALDEYDKTSNDPTLKRNILSQSSRILVSIKLYEEALSYIEASIETDYELKDTIGVIYDAQMAGDVSLKMGNFEKADKYLQRALRLSENKSESLKALSKVLIAGLYFKKGEIDSALYYIRNTYNQVSEVSKNKALSHASLIYMRAGMLDSAYSCARNLVSSSNPNNRQIGYYVLLSPELGGKVNADSLSSYAASYRNLLEKKFDDNEAEMTINKHNLYNYRLHERKRAEAEKQNRLLLYSLIGTAFLLLLSAIIIIYRKYKSNEKIIRLQALLDSMNQSALRIPDNVAQSSFKVREETETFSDFVDEERAEEERATLRAELITLSENEPNISVSPSEVLPTDIYSELRDRLANGRSVADNDPLWKDIKRAVLRLYPDLIKKINILSTSQMTAVEWHTIYLIKCGYTPSQMTILFSKSNGAIISRRKTISTKLLGTSAKMKVIDYVLRSL